MDLRTTLFEKNEYKYVLFGPIKNWSIKFSANLMIKERKISCWIFEKNNNLRMF